MRHATVAASIEVVGIVSDACHTMGVAPDKLSLLLVVEYSQLKCDEIFATHTAKKQRLSAENGVMAAYVHGKQSEYTKKKDNAAARFEAISGSLNDMKQHMHDNVVTVTTEIGRLNAKFEACATYNTIIGVEIDNLNNYATEVGLVEADEEAMVVDIRPKLACMEAAISVSKVEFVAARTLMYHRHNILRSSVEKRGRALSLTHACKNKRRRTGNAAAHDRSAV